MFPLFKVRIPRLGRLDSILVLLLILSALAWLAERLAGWSVPGRGVLQFLAYIAAFLLAFKLLRLWIRTLLWRVRNRMILLFLFVGLVPLILVTALVGLAGYILTGQVAVYIATSELDRRAGRLQGTAAALVWSLRAAPAARRAELVNSYLTSAAENWPGLQARVLDSGRTTVFPPGAGLEPPYPPGRELRGIVRLGRSFYLVAHASSPSATSAVKPAAESVTAPRPKEAEKPGAASAQKQDQLQVILLQPLNDSYLAQLAPGLGRISFVTYRHRGAAESESETAGRTGPGPTLRVNEDVFTPEPGASPEAASRTPLPAPAYRFDYAVTWLTLPFPLERWREDDRETYASVQIQTRPSAVFRILFGQSVEVVQGVVIFMIAVGTLFLVVELLSLVIGVSITRTLTRSVHQLYQGTQWVNKGDFSHRIEVSGNDQLAELSRSFNVMTESIERLIEESKEGERLASELEIAREVQEQLFPKAPPVMRGLEILGVCNAARMVSGDYFDFVKLSEQRLAWAIGDVAGKGISGALLMASIQSMLRTQLSAAWGMSAAAGAEADTDGAVWRFPTASLVSQLNLQLYENTSPEKYATFFFGAYDDQHGMLTYTNAGHLPPLLIREEKVQRLDVNGMVVGAFPHSRYEQSEIALRRGDLVVAFTDGVTEPENEFAEEFGEDRLIDVVLRNRRRSPREIIDEVIGAVGHWTGRPELQDDMTMVVARRL
ncbi:MAG: SpoIIE family protein phosphatase [Acidobacteria bacterium]|nr:SpoIIE family protein phosphatase [Acidobacteriota bacterium]